ATGSGLSSRETEKSAVLLTVVVSVSLLFAGTGSEVSLVTLAESDSGPVLPTGTWTLKLKEAEVTLKVVQVQVMVPVPPDAGVVQGLVGATPPAKIKELNVVPAGTASVKMTFCAMAG